MKLKSTTFNDAISLRVTTFGASARFSSYSFSSSFSLVLVYIYIYMVEINETSRLVIVNDDIFHGVEYRFGSLGLAISRPHAKISFMKVS